jgi:hypothetical protein
MIKTDYINKNAQITFFNANLLLYKIDEEIL